MKIKLIIIYILIFQKIDFFVIILILVFYIFYEGDWVNNQQHGNGMFCENNNIIKGIFRFGKLIKIQEGNLNDKKEDDLKNNINEKMQIDEKEIKIFDNHEFEVKKEDTDNKNI